MIVSFNASLLLPHQLVLSLPSSKGRIQDLWAGRTGAGHRQHAACPILLTFLSPMTRQLCTSILEAAGLSEQMMRNWHIQFDKATPDEHDRFFELLQIPDEEIEMIPHWSNEWLFRPFKRSGSLDANLDCALVTRGLNLTTWPDLIEQRKTTAVSIAKTIITIFFFSCCTYGCRPYLAYIEL